LADIGMIPLIGPIDDILVDRVFQPVLDKSSGVTGQSGMTIASNVLLSGAVAFLVTAGTLIFEMVLKPTPFSHIGAAMTAACSLFFIWLVRQQWQQAAQFERDAERSGAANPVRRTGFYLRWYFLIMSIWKLANFGLGLTPFDLFSIADLVSVILLAFGNFFLACSANPPPSRLRSPNAVGAAA
jgi:hypothetical protein